MPNCLFYSVIIQFWSTASGASILNHSHFISLAKVTANIYHLSSTASQCQLSCSSGSSALTSSAVSAIRIWKQQLLHLLHSPSSSSTLTSSTVLLEKSGPTVLYQRIKTTLSAQHERTTVVQKIKNKRDQPVPNPGSSVQLEIVQNNENSDGKLRRSVQIYC